MLDQRKRVRNGYRRPVALLLMICLISAVIPILPGGVDLVFANDIVRTGNSQNIFITNYTGMYIDYANASDGNYSPAASSSITSNADFTINSSYTFSLSGTFQLNSFEFSYPYSGNAPTKFTIYTSNDNGSSYHPIYIYDNPTHSISSTYVTGGYRTYSTIILFEDVFNAGLNNIYGSYRNAVTNIKVEFSRMYTSNCSLSICELNFDGYRVSPAIPASASASSITSTGFQANWNQASGATGYTVEVSKATDNFTTYSAIDSSTNSIAINGLSPGTAYLYRVKSFNTNTSNNISGYSAIESVTTSKQTQTITFGAISSAVYGDAPIALTAETSSGLAPTYTSSNTSVAAISGSSLVIVGPGTATISAIQEGNTTYAAATVNQPLTVSPRTLQVTGSFSADGKPYDGTTTASILTNNLTLSGIVSGDAVTFTPVLTFSNKDEGAKTVSLTNTSTLSGTDSGKYQLDLTGAPTSSAVISKKELTVSGISVTSKMYDGTTAAAISGGTLVGVVGSEDVSLTYAAVGSFGNKNVGNNKAVSTIMELTGSAISNYTLTQPILTGAITAKEVTVSDAAVVSKIYDGTTSAAITGAALEGKIVGDDVSLTGTTFGSFTNKDVNTGIAVTPFFGLGGSDASNYALTQPTLTGSIILKPLIITADNKTKTYDGTTFSAFTASYNSFAAGESVSDLFGTLQFGGNAVTATAAGVYTITAGGLSSTNYDISYVDGTLTIAAISSRSSSSSNSNNPATTSTTTVNGQQASVMTLNPQAITQMLSQSLSQIQNQNQANTDTAGINGPEITLQFTNPQPVNLATLDGQILQTLISQNASLVMETQNATYSVPTAQIDLVGVAQQLGPDVPAAAVKLEITIAEPNAAQAKIVEDTSAKGGFQVVVPPVDFSITCSYGEKSVEVSGFDSYVARMVAIPQNVDVGKVSTAVVVRQDGTWYHVPTRIVTIDGKYFAQINSLSNSTYVMIWNPVTFKDMEKHWAKEAVNDLGSRFVVSGYGNDTFSPERSITRSEFAAILMKGLGLSPAGGSSNFKDITAKDWYAGYVNTAFNYKLISGYPDQTFHPGERITREQAMVMIARAMKITGLTVSLKDGETAAILAKYKDSSAAQSYAREGIATCIKAGVVSGRNDGKLGAKASITRAEVAIIIRNLLIKSDLI